MADLHGGIRYQLFVAVVLGASSLVHYEAPAPVGLPVQALKFTCSQSDLASSGELFKLNFFSTSWVYFMCNDY